MKTITVHGERFEVIKPKYPQHHYDMLEYHAGRPLDECYDRPSPAKQEIYGHWLDWAFACGVHYFGVSGYNCMQFTLQGLLHHEGHRYVIRITKSRNIAYLVQ